MAPHDVRPRTPSRSTRELLDELDSLMERMLALPVEDEPVPTTSAPTEAAPPPAPATPVAPVAVTMTRLGDQALPANGSRDESTWTEGLFELPPTEKAVALPSHEMPPALEVSAEPATQGAMVSATWSPVPDFTEPSPEEPEIEFAEYDTDPPAAPISLPPTLAKSYRRRPRLRGPYAWMLRVNLTYDRATRFLGPVGRGLRGQSFRSVLGVLGLTLLAAAIGWLLRDGWRWTW